LYEENRMVPLRRNFAVDMKQFSPRVV
jgi:hypothetical protein